MRSLFRAIMLGAAVTFGLLYSEARGFVTGYQAGKETVKGHE